MSTTMLLLAAVAVAVALPFFGADPTGFDLLAAAAGRFFERFFAPALAPWLGEALDQVSDDWFGEPSVAMGEGGSIPFMGMLGEKFPDAQFVITGVLGPHSNAHGPNEFLEIQTARRLTGCVAQLLSIHASR